MLKKWRRSGNFGLQQSKRTNGAMNKVKKSALENTNKPKEKYKVKNWSAYNKALTNRGSITLWLSDDVIDSWYHQGERQPGGKMKYSDACIICLLSIKSLFGLGFRQTEGFGRSLIGLMGLDLIMPSYTQINRRQGKLKVSIRAQDRQKMENGRHEGIHILVDSTGLKVYGEGEWKTRMHGVSKRRTWLKLHLAINEQTNDLEAVELTTNAIDDAEMVKPLVEQIENPICKFGGDGAYDKVKVYDYLEQEEITPIIPPREDAIIWTDKTGKDLDHPRNKAILEIEKVGSKEWKKQSGYHRRSKAEVAMFRFKTIFGPKTYARKFENQKTEVRIKCACINKFNQLGMPISVRVA
jgi:hypothetical protein